MTATLSCAQCSAPLAPDDRYCSACGATSGRIVWSISRTRRPEAGAIQLKPGESFFLLAQNTGRNTVRVEVDAKRARGVMLKGISQAQAPGGQICPFELVHIPGQTISGQLLARSQDRRRSVWWERADWREETLRLASGVRVAVDRWVFGSPAILFPPGVTLQSVRVWNASDRERTLETDPPEGYRVLCFGNAVEQSPPKIGPYQTTELKVQARPIGPYDPPDDAWEPDTQGEAFPLIRMPDTPPEIGSDLVVAIDFGTCNTGIRVRWRRTLFAGKPAGTVDSITDREGATTETAVRFPTAMVMHLRDRTFSWGSEAANRIARNLLGPEEIAVDNLKTYLRTDQSPYLKYRADWSNEKLLELYFEQIFLRLDHYFRSVDAAGGVSRKNLNIRYVLTRPVLDANQGDRIGKVYEAALTGAMARNGVPKEQIVFLPEPVAAAIGISRRHEQELMQIDGEGIAIVDAGGGTTDIALSRVRLRGGTVALEIAGSYALHLEPENPALPALEQFGYDRVEFGGNTIDRALAFRLLTDAEDLLETEGRPVPPRLQPVQPGEANAADETTVKREFLAVCRTLKERFLFSSMIYLNRSPDHPPAEGEVFPFANRPEYAGIYLYHGVFDEILLGPILQPVIGKLREEMGRTLAEAGPSGLRPAQIRHVFYVGGTDLDANVREQFRRAFPDTPPDYEGVERLEERLCAVVEGALWAEEQLFTPSPLSLNLLLDGKSLPLIAQGEPLRPEAVAQPRFETTILEPGETLDAGLTASEGGLAEPVPVARAFYLNATDASQEVTLRLKVSREKGATASLQVGNREYEQWQFALKGGGRG